MMVVLVLGVLLSDEIMHMMLVAWGFCSFAKRCVCFFSIGEKVLERAKWQHQRQGILTQTKVSQETDGKLATSSSRECHWMAPTMLLAVDDDDENYSDQKSEEGRRTRFDQVDTQRK